MKETPRGNCYFIAENKEKQKRMASASLRPRLPWANGSLPPHGTRSGCQPQEQSERDSLSAQLICAAECVPRRWRMHCSLERETAWQGRILMTGIWRPYSANLISFKLVLITTEFIVGKESDVCHLFSAATTTPISLSPSTGQVKPSERLACCAWSFSLVVTPSCTRNCPKTIQHGLSPL